MGGALGVVSHSHFPPTSLIDALADYGPGGSARTGGEIPDGGGRGECKP